MTKNMSRGMVASALLAITAVAFLAHTAVGQKRQAEQTLKTVSSVDLNKYAGRWYEIARLPARFQKDCASDVSAMYTLRADGKVDVLNQCRKASGKMKKADGKAKIMDKTTNAKLKVSFFWPFYGDYWILELGNQYEYAVVGEPGRKYLWILSRSPQMDEKLYQTLLGKIAVQGFDTSKLIKTRHTL